MYNLGFGLEKSFTQIYCYRPITNKTNKMYYQKRLQCLANRLGLTKEVESEVSKEKGDAPLL